MGSMFFLLLVLGVGCVMAIRLLPWWVLPALVAGGLLSIRLLLRWGLPRLLKAPFRAKGAVLRGATATVHSVERVDAPPTGPDGDDSAEASEPRAHFLVDVTIAPRPVPNGPFSLWTPGELCLVRPDAKAEDPDDAESAGDVYAVEVEHDGRFGADEGMKYGGPQRLLLHVALKPDQRRIRFRYYFEVFGDIAIPESAAVEPVRVGVR